MNPFLLILLIVAASAVEEPEGSSLLRGGSNERTLRSSWWPPRHWCPQVRCANPCVNQCAKDETCVTKPSRFYRRCPGCPVFDKCVPMIRDIDICPVPSCVPVQCPCRNDQKCITKPGFFRSNGGKRCPGCPVFDRCEDPLIAIDICPIPACVRPDCPCGIGQTCKTRTSFFDFNGKKCPGCPVFDGCEGPSPQTCGNQVCGEGLVCCNASCGVCTPPGGFCTQQACGPVYRNSGY